MPGIPFTDYIDMQNNQIRGVGAPTADDHVATRAYVDQIIRGLSHKTPVRAAATTNINIASPGAGLGGVAALAVNDRVVLAGQTTQSQNGLYIWNGAAVPLTRATDADESSEIRPGMTFVVTEGDQADRFAIMTADGTITVGTTAITFAFVPIGAGASLGAGDGIEIVSNNIRVKLPANSGLVVDGNGLKIDVGVVARKFSQDVGNGSLSSIPVTHNLGTKDVTVALEELSSGRSVIPSVSARTVNSVTLNFGTAPTTGQYRVTVTG